MLKQIRRILIFIDFVKQTAFDAIIFDRETQNQVTDIGFPLELPLTVPLIANIAVY